MPHSRPHLPLGQWTAIIAALLHTGIPGSYSYSLRAVTPVQLNTATSDYFFYFDPNVPVSNDADVVSIHEDFYGLPWDTFMYNASPPVSWLLRLNATVAAVNAWKKPVFLTLQMGTGQLRSCPAANASDGPGYSPQVTPFAGCAQCYEYDPVKNPAAALVRSAYIQYATYMVYMLHPRYLNIAAEINLPQRLCPDQWAGQVSFVNQAFDALKAIYPTLQIFPSLQLEALMGLQTGPDQPCVGMGGGTSEPSSALLQCIDNGLAIVSGMKRDAFALSTYPHTIMAGIPKQGPTWEDWYFPSVFSRLNSSDATRIIIAETGFVADSMVINLGNGTTPLPMDVPAYNNGGDEGDKRRETQELICYPLLNSSIPDASAWLQYILTQATTYNMPLVTWWSDMDLLFSTAMSSCPCYVPNPTYNTSCTFIAAYRQIAIDSGGVAWMGELQSKAFGTMGLRNVIGTPKGHMLDMWQAFGRETTT
jgi:hypothetical protein